MGRTECAPIEVELDVRSLAAARSALEVSLLLESAHARDEARRKAADGDVVRRGHLVVALALDGDAVLGSFELRLQFEEVLIRLEVGILLDDDQQPRERAGETGLGLLELGQLRRIVRNGRTGSRRSARRGNLSHARAGVDDRFERRLLEIRRALNGADEIRDEVIPPLILALDLRPLRVDLLVETDQVVPDSDEVTAKNQDGQNQRPDTTQQSEILHISTLLLPLPALLRGCRRRNPLLLRLPRPRRSAPPE
jgi:hypothetical protein